MTERRLSSRMNLEDFSAKIFMEDREIEYFPINVSAEGFSIFTSKSIAVGSSLVMELGLTKIPLVVKWCKVKPDDAAVYRCGLARADAGTALDELVKAELSYYEPAS